MHAQDLQILALLFTIVNDISEHMTPFYVYMNMLMLVSSDTNSTICYHWLTSKSKFVGGSIVSGSSHIAIL